MFFFDKIVRMEVFNAQFLINCHNYINETYHFDQYDSRENIKLQNVIVSGTPWSDSVSASLSNF